MNSEESVKAQLSLRKSKNQVEWDTLVGNISDFIRCYYGPFFAGMILAEIVVIAMFNAFLASILVLVIILWFGFRLIK